MMRICSLRLIETRQSSIAFRHLANTASEFLPRRPNPSPNTFLLHQILSGARVFRGALPKCIRSFSVTAHKSRTPIPPPAATTETDEQSYKFHTAASYSPKGLQYNPERDAWYSDGRGGHIVPKKPKLRSDAGQDAFFVAELGDGDAVAVGVADGVGGYSSLGIDSALFSQGLCVGMASAAWKTPVNKLDPRVVMDDAYNRINDEGKIRGGASTACVGVFRRNGRFTAANLGDSGFMILRSGKVLYFSPPQTHSFNCPLQLSAIPKRYHFEVHTDLPRDAAQSSHSLCEGDVVIFATDGVWDNLTNQQILRCASEVMLRVGAWEIGGDSGHGITPSLSLSSDSITQHGVHVAIARSVVTMAKSASINTKVDGPFAKDVQRLFPNEQYRGGKVDDICVVATVVVKNEAAARR
ncbi:5-azacytidine resistance protein azr1 [Sphaerosporella brunnea]|uniref:Protein phosphatase n=1 Tax=Sphaerosporella brunnea TaxID=1250544 RepID=A0A5J5EMP8_9PEZI|nr:5-azacytidine resistance protein azr1 [Sphaerosporella brunnea]